MTFFGMSNDSTHSTFVTVTKTRLISMRDVATLSTVHASHALSFRRNLVAAESLRLPFGETYHQSVV